MMAVENVNDLLLHELGDLLYAEKQILKSLPKLIKESSDGEMRERLEAHKDETEEQIQKLERSFEAMGRKPRAQKCPGILGILEEKKEFDAEEDATREMTEAFNLGAGLRVEHYEIAGYRSAIALAKTAGADEVSSLLRENLEQEVAMARFIETSSRKMLKKVAGPAGPVGA